MWRVANSYSRWVWMVNGQNDFDLTPLYLGRTLARWQDCLIRQSLCIDCNIIPFSCTQQVINAPVLSCAFWQNHLMVRVTKISMLLWMVDGDSAAVPFSWSSHFKTPFLLTEKTFFYCCVLIICNFWFASQVLSSSQNLLAFGFWFQ